MAIETDITNAALPTVIKIRIRRTYSSADYYTVRTLYLCIDEMVALSGEEEVVVIEANTVGSDSDGSAK